MPLVHPAADVWALLADIADETPDAPAFIHGERRLSFAELLDSAARAAQGLADLGVGPGDRVALWLPNIPAYPVLYFACARLGDLDGAVARVDRDRDGAEPGAGEVEDAGCARLRRRRPMARDWRAKGRSRLSRGRAGRPSH